MTLPVGPRNCGQSCPRNAAPDDGEQRGAATAVRRMSAWYMVADVYARAYARAISTADAASQLDAGREPRSAILPAHDAPAALLRPLCSRPTRPDRRSAWPPLDWPQYLGARRDGVYRGPPLADAWPAGGRASVEEAGRRRASAGRWWRTASSSSSIASARGSRRGAGRQDRRAAVALRLPHHLSRRLRLRRRPPRGAGRRRRHRLHLRRRGPAARGRPGRRQEALERGHGARATAWRRASSAPPARRWSRTAA